MGFETPAPIKSPEPLYDENGLVNDPEIARHMAIVQETLQNQNLDKQSIEDMVESAGHIRQYAKEMESEKEKLREIAEKMFRSLSEEEKNTIRNVIQKNEHDPEGIYKILVESLKK